MYTTENTPAMQEKIDHSYTRQRLSSLVGVRCKLHSVHSMSHACGADQTLRLHHGTLNAVLLPTILDFNRDYVGDKYTRLSEAMGIGSSSDPADFIRELNVEMGLPATLSEMGIQKSAIPALASHAAKDICTFTNPRPCTAAEYEVLFATALAE